MNVNNSEKKNLLIAALAVLMTVMALVSCAPSELRKTNGDNVDLYFGYLEAKDVNETAYDVTVNDPTWTAPNVVVGNAADYYWSYTAVKGDNLFKEGETTAQKNVSTGAGLSGTHNFSKGKWTFTLYAYKTSEERTTGTKYIFKGEKTGTWTAGGSIDVPVSYAYIAGTGTARFNFTVTISQEDSSTFGTTYKATKVIASIGGNNYELSNTSGTNTWSKTTSQGIASGVQTVGLKVYVDNESSPRIDKTLGSAVILHGLTTEIGGSATISLTAAKAEVTFSPVLPTSQPTEEDLKYSQYSQYSVGSTGPAGGTIFYDAGSVQTSYYMDGSTKKSYTWRFLEAAPADASTSTAIFGYYRTSSTGSNLAVQSNLDTSITAADHSTYNGNASVGQGRMNTSLLVNAMGTTAAYSSSSGTDTTVTYAANLCDDYTYGGFDDWFLPSIEELRYMYENLYLKDLGTWSYYYWSSSEYSASRAWGCIVNSGYAYDGYRDNTISVRAVRAF